MDAYISHMSMIFFLFNLLPSLVKTFYRSDEYRCTNSRVIRDIFIIVHRGYEYDLYCVQYLSSTTDGSRNRQYNALGSLIFPPLNSPVPVRYPIHRYAR